MRHLWLSVLLVGCQASLDALEPDPLATVSVARTRDAGISSPTVTRRGTVSIDATSGLWLTANFIESPSTLPAEECLSPGKCVLRHAPGCDSTLQLLPGERLLSAGTLVMAARHRVNATPGAAAQYRGGSDERLDDISSLTVEATGGEVPPFRVDFAPLPDLETLSVGTCGRSLTCEFSRSTDIRVDGSSVVFLRSSKARLSCEFPNGGVIPAAALQALGSNHAEMVSGVVRFATPDAGGANITARVYRLATQKVELLR